MKPIVKVGGVLIAVAMLLLVFLNPKSCQKNDPIVPSKRECSIHALKGTINSGEDIEYKMESLTDKIVVDSVVMIDEIPFEAGPISTYDLPLGRHLLKARYSYQDSSTCESSWSIEILSDKEPDVLAYSLINTFEHDVTAYTQGLTWYQGRLYEGTGQYGESLIRNYTPEKLDYSQEVELPLNLFGEGITILDDKLYQLTYKARKGIVYDLTSMEQLKEFDIPTTEGWGLTDDGANLIMSDGTNILTYLDPVTFQVVREQAIYNHKGKEVAINEMEYVEGYIYANLYGASYLVVIDADSGKVVSYIDCRGILPPEYETQELDVFNGIAYDSVRRTFFLTGKYWPKMFEVRFVPKAL